jgi:cyclic pyranopterin monophosphate synthase
MEEGLSHVDGAGAARMVDVSDKPRVRRTAKATGRVDMAPATVSLVRRNALQKGDVLAAARIAGIMGAKRASELIPLCHNIEIEQVAVELSVDDRGVAIEATALCTDKTGIEMEALTAVSISALTVYDMCKAVDRGMVLRDIRLVGKTKEEA